MKLPKYLIFYCVDHIYIYYISVENQDTCSDTKSVDPMTGKSFIVTTIVFVLKGVK
jgi:hypothetical protein